MSPEGSSGGEGDSDESTVSDTGISEVGPDIQIDVDDSDDFSSRLVSVVDALKTTTTEETACSIDAAEPVGDESDSEPRDVFRGKRGLRKEVVIKYFERMCSHAFLGLGFVEIEFGKYDTKYVSRYSAPEKFSFDEVLVVIEPSGRDGLTTLRIASNGDEVNYAGRVRVTEYVEGGSEGSVRPTPKRKELEEKLRNVFEN